MNKLTLSCALALAGVFAAGHADAAQLLLLNGDAGTGAGLDDPSAKAPQGSNPGTTLGAQRRIAYQFAMDMWGTVLQSNVPIKVAASFQPLTCTPTSGTLGSAGPNWIDHDFTNAPRPGIWYHSALADSLAGIDLDNDPSDPADIVSRFNGDLGVNPNCLTGLDWYYGLDGITPAGSINFLNVVMHEIGHGLGFSGFLSKTTGAFGDYDGTGPRSDTYTQNAYDNVLNLGFNDPVMTAAQRATAMKTPGRLVWAGNRVRAEAGLVLGNRTALRVTAPAPAVGSYEIEFASFGPIATPTSFPANQVVLVDDGVASNSNGCEAPFVNAAAISGKIALIDRGICGFTVKVKNAQLNGAIAVIIANNVPGVFGMGGADATITIPSVMVSQADGATLKANQPASVNLFVDPNLFQGADNAGHVRLYAPTTVAGGSTFSHYDTALQPNALMEPFDSPTVQSQVDVDLTPALFADIGWALNPGNATLAGCDTTVDAVELGGLIIGANVSAYSNMCAASSGGNRTTYTRCIGDQAAKLKQMGAITNAQLSKVRACSTLVRP